MSTVERPRLSFWQKLYLPEIFRGLVITFRHLVEPRKFTLRYPEEKPVLPRGYRGAPTLVRDDEGREKCVACSMCEVVCPPKAIRIQPAEIQDPNSKIERYPEEFQINMLRCIFCGLCEEACPENAIVLLQDFSLADYTREELIFDKRKLYELGGTIPDPIKKWKRK